MANDVKKTLVNAANASELLKAIENGSEDMKFSKFCSPEKVGITEFHLRTGMVCVNFGNVMQNSVLGENLNEDEKAFSNSFSSLKAPALLTQQKKIQNIARSIRFKLAKLTIGGSNYQTIEDFKEFIDFFQKKEIEFNDVLKEIDECYDKEIAEYKEKVATIAAKTLEPEQASFVLEKLDNSCVPKDVFLDKFKLIIKTSFEENIEQLNDEELEAVVKRLSKEANEQILKDNVIIQLEDAFNQVKCFRNQLMQIRGESTISIPKTKEALKSGAKGIKRRNIANIGIINNICNELENLADEEVKIFAEDKVNEIMATCLGYAKDFGEELPVKDLDASFIDLLMSMYNAS